ncbi:transposase [Streptomyces sp. NPDC088730]|uniref:transposase n=1 Tax=Streptomyces sp. NPDC088730 TaxID=3365877 RepID=UPI0038138421
MDAAARLHRVTLVGPLPASTSPQHRAEDGFGRENFVIDFDQREVTCPNGQVSGNWQDLPVAEPTSVTVRFDARQCGRCPEQTGCPPGSFRSLYFPARRLHELQAKNRADQQDANWRKLYGLRSGAEGTIEDFAHGYRGRRCRYHGLAKTHIQHVLTALAINVERLSLQEPADATHLRHSSSTSTHAAYAAPCGGDKANDPGTQDSRQSRSLRASMEPASGNISTAVNAKPVIMVRV